jgi:hypothetical protein
VWPNVGSHVRAWGLTASLSDTTIWRWLNEDAIRPWQHRCWIFPRDPDFETKAGRILDLYQRLWKGRKLATDELVLSADEKTSKLGRSESPNQTLRLARLEAGELYRGLRRGIKLLAVMALEDS